MDFEWDEAKRRSNIEKHGIDFLRVRQLFDGRPVFSQPSPRDGENRFVTIGSIGGAIIAAIWVERDGVTRLISARKARDEEKRKYRSVLG
jgi:uncharacterized DUF497 family protein